MFKSKNNYTALYLTFTLFWGLCYGFVLLSSAAGAGELIDNHLLFRHGNKWQYKWESIILLNENGSDQKDVGFLLSSNVNVESIWNNREKLLKIHVSQFNNYNNNSTNKQEMIIANFKKKQAGSP